MAEYEDILSIEQLRIEARNGWDFEMELSLALIDLPLIPPRIVLRGLNHAASKWRTDNVWEIGKALQREHGLDAIPPNTEYEYAAGLWSVLRNALLAQRKTSEA